MSGSEATVDTTEGVRSEEEVQKEQNTSDLKESSADVGLLDQPLIVQGKRKRKSVESFQASTATPAKKKRLSVSDGHGRRLGDLNLDFGNRQSDELRPLYKLLFNTPGQVRSIKRNIGDFCGFTFERDDPEFSKRRASLAKFQKQGLVTNFCKPLGLSVGGSKDEVIDRILEFLLKPSGKGQAEKVTPKSTGKKRARKAKASPEKEEEQQEVADEDGLEGGKEEEEEKHDDECLENAEEMDEQEPEKKQDEVEEEDKEAVEKVEDEKAVEKEEDEKAVEKEEDEKAEEKEEVGEAVEKEEVGEAVEKEEDEEAVGKEEEAGVGEAQAESGEKQEETEDKQESTVVTEDPPHECEKEGTEVEGKQEDNGVAGGETPGGCDQEMDTSTAPTSAESAKKVHASVEDADNHQALEQVKAED